jgi:hypothetical protein
MDGELPRKLGYSCYSRRKHFDPDSYAPSRGRPPLQNNNTSPSPEPVMPGAWPSATLTDDRLSQNKRARFPAVQEGYEYRGLGMMGTSAWDVSPSTLSRNASNQRSYNPSQGMMPSDLYLLEPYTVAAAENAAEDNLRRIMATSINDNSKREGSRQNTPPSYIPHQDIPNLIPSNLNYYNEAARAPPLPRTVATSSWDFPSQDVCSPQLGPSRLSTPPRKNLPHPSATQSSFPSVSTLHHSTYRSPAAISTIRRSRTNATPETPRTSSPFNGAISLHCSSHSRSFTPQQNYPFPDDSILDEIDSPLETSVLNTLFIPLDEDPNLNINDCEESWDELFPAEKGDLEDTQRSFHTSFSSYSQQRRNGRSERPNPWHAVSQQSLPRHATTEREASTRSTQYFQQYVEAEALVDRYQRRRREFLTSDPELAYTSARAHQALSSEADEQEAYIPTVFNRTLSEASSCTLRNETPETEEGSKELTVPVELVEWVPSQKHQQIMAMYDTESDIEDNVSQTGSLTDDHNQNNHNSAKSREMNDRCSVDIEPTSTPERLNRIQSLLTSEPSRKRKFEGPDALEQSDLEVYKVEETPPPSKKRSRLSLSSSNMESVPEAPTSSLRRGRYYVSSSDIDEDELSSISSEDTPVRATERRTWKLKLTTPKISASRSNRKVSLNEFRELPLLPETSLSEILRARFGRSATSTPTRRPKIPLEYSTPSTATLASPSSFSDSQFQYVFQSAFDDWMEGHGRKIVEVAVQKAVKEMMAARHVDGGMAKEERVKERRDEEVVEVEDSQGRTDDDEL